jgi:hypothetical protein
METANNNDYSSSEKKEGQLIFNDSMFDEQDETQPLFA